MREDTNNDNTGDVVLSGVAITLFSDAGGFVATTRTDSSGKYEFCNLSPGSYVVLEINLPGFGDVSDTDGANDNSIRVQLGVGERSPGHDFVDERVPGTPAPTPVGQTAVPTSGSPAATPVPTPVGPTSLSPAVTAAPTPTSVLSLGSISGNVKEDLDNNDSGDVDLGNVFITLFDKSGIVVGTTITDFGGRFVFYNLLPGNYTVMETNLAGYVDVSDVDGANDNTVSVRLGAGTNSTGNDFVDEVISSPPSTSPSSSILPSTDPSVSGAPSLTATPSVNPSGSISGSVKEDTNNDNIGDMPLSNVLISLVDSVTGQVIRTTLTDSSGSFFV